MVFVRQTALLSWLSGFMLIFILFSNSANACGYSFVGSCSTHIGLSVNGTQDSFPVGGCAVGALLGDLKLGNIRTLRMTSVNAITWESCINNVTKVMLYYRVYEEGHTNTAWRSILLGDDSVRVEGPYTSRYRGKHVDMELSQGLTVGKKYLLEVYFKAEVDTLGDDFIPETVLYQNNNGSNYIVSFEYGGASAPPFTTVVTRHTPALCYGDSSGIAGVTLFGDARDVHYDWSSGSYNYHTLFKLPKGQYTVTVTASNAVPQSRVIVIEEPTPLSATFSNLEPAGCNNRPGRAVAAATGGIAPYQYFWESGNEGAEGSLPNAGNWRVTVSDANQCKKTFSVAIATSNIIAVRNMQREVCYGDTLRIDGLRFSQTGRYEYAIANPTGCDTIVRLDLKVLNPHTAFVGLPDNAQIVCLSPSIDLCAQIIPGESVMWSKNGINLSAQSCYRITSGGEYILTASLSGSNTVCVAQKKINIEAKLFPPHLNANLKTEVLPCRKDSVLIIGTLTTDAEQPVLEWKINNESFSDQSVFRFKTAPADLTMWHINVNVVDKYGCQTNSGDLIPMPVAVPEPLVLNVAASLASGPQKADGSVEATVFAGTPPYRYEWSNGSSTARVEGLQPGLYCVTVKDALDCAIEGCQRVEFTSGLRDIPVLTGSIAPNPVVSGQPLSVSIPALASETRMRLVLTNLQGQRQYIWHDTPLSLPLTIPDHLPSGVYTLTLQTDQGIFTGRVLVMNDDR
jgi:SprB repeat